MRSRLFRLAALASFSLLSGCGLGHGLGLTSNGGDARLGQGKVPPSVFGYAVADEPQAALVGRDILNEGGNAADAAAAEGLALAVTLPSRAGLGGGGACLIKMPNADGDMQAPVALLFPAGSPAGTSGGRPAAVPAFARGLLALQARYGQLPLSDIIVPAERLAASAQLTPALEADLKVVGNALLADPAAAAIFAPNGQLLPAGATIHQPDLAATLEILRTQGVSGLYAGGFAQQFVQAAQAAGGGLTPRDMSLGLPRYTAPVSGTEDGYATAALPTASAAGKTLPASAGFMALDKDGGVVTCVSSMNNLFGTGRYAAGTGILLAASPRTTPAPQLAAAIAYAPGSLKFRAATTGTGQNAAALAATTALSNALAGHPGQAVPNPGRANVISCPKGVPGGEASCMASADPRGQGLAIGGR